MVGRLCRLPGSHPHLISYRMVGRLCEVPGDLLHIGRSGGYAQVGRICRRRSDGYAWTTRVRQGLSTPSVAR